VLQRKGASRPVRRGDMVPPTALTPNHPLNDPPPHPRTRARSFVPVLITEAIEKRQVNPPPARLMPFA